MVVGLFAGCWRFGGRRRTGESYPQRRPETEIVKWRLDYFTIVWRMNRAYPEQMKITVYRKSGCPWAAAVMGFLNELSVPYEIKNVTTHPAYAEEVKAVSGQCMSPTLDIDGAILPDASVEDVAKVLEQRGIVI
jgi:glutaredoxin